MSIRNTIDSRPHGPCLKYRITPVAMITTGTHTTINGKYIILSR